MVKYMIVIKKVYRRIVNTYHTLQQVFKGLLLYCWKRLPIVFMLCCHSSVRMHNV